MILAAGRGERMLPLTEHRPKPLLEIGGQTLIDRHLAALFKAGFREVVINVHHLQHLIELHVGSGARYGLKVMYSPEPTLLETAGGIQQALPMLGPEPFLVVNGDVVTDMDFAVPASGRLAGVGHLMMVPNPAHHPEGDFGLDDNGCLTTLAPRYTYSGVGIYSTAFFEGRPKGAGALRPLLDAHINGKRITGELFEGLWIDIGTPERLRMAEQMPGV